MNVKNHTTNIMVIVLKNALKDLIAMCMTKLNVMTAKQDVKNAVVIINALNVI